ncbi:hypothetical protein JTB14_034618 [Gonioctena quinquepunctata]|nr:hypothetical protein JTB14_034618 [Gonioctena quinquepunctata]
MKMGKMPKNISSPDPEGVPDTFEKELQLTNRDVEDKTGKLSKVKFVFLHTSDSTCEFPTPSELPPRYKGVCGSDSQPNTETENPATISKNSEGFLYTFKEDIEDINTDIENKLGKLPNEKSIFPHTSERTDFLTPSELPPRYKGAHDTDPLPNAELKK